MSTTEFLYGVIPCTVDVDIDLGKGDATQAVTDFPDQIAAQLAQQPGDVSPEILALTVPTEVILQRRTDSSVGSPAH